MSLHSEAIHSATHNTPHDNLPVECPESITSNH